MNTVTSLRQRVLDSGFESDWRRRMARTICEQLDRGRFGVRDVYLFGSVEAGDAGPRSDIDLIVHLDGDDQQRGALLEWLGVWDAVLCSLCESMTGLRPEYMLDIHLVGERELARSDPFGEKMRSVWEVSSLMGA